MSFKHQHDAQGGFLRIMGAGNSSALEARVSTRTFARDNAIAASLPVLLDLGEMDDLVTGFDLESLIGYIDELQSMFHSKVAIVDARSGHATICQLVAASVTRPDMVKAFMQEADARAWLAT